MEENGKQKKQRLSTKVRKQMYLEALEKTMGIQTPARKMVGNLSPETVRQWREKDKDFAAKMDECKSMCGDFVESKLFQKINEGDTTAIIFYCKTKLKNRGYVERNELVGKDGEPLMKAKLLTKEQAKELINEIEKEV